jgi:nucleoside-triphosphatase
MKLLLTGPPGVGKTTVVKKIIQGIDVDAGGFFTQEIRAKGKRIGFILKTLENEEGVLAHIDYKGRCRVGRYGVNLSLFETIAIPALEKSLKEREIIIIDEIGKMELFSQRFREMIRQILDQDEKHLLGVIHQGRDPFIGSIKRRSDVEVISINHENRDKIPFQIITRIAG